MLLHWAGLDHGDKQMLDHVRFTRELIELRWRHPGLRGQGFRVVHAHDANRVLAFHRWVEGVGQDVIVVVHLATFHRFGYRIGFPGDGEWREVFNSDVYENWVFAPAGDRAESRRGDAERALRRTARGSPRGRSARGGLVVLFGSCGSGRCAPDERSGVAVACDGQAAAHERESGRVSGAFQSLTSRRYCDTDEALAGRNAGRSRSPRAPRLE